MNGYSDQLTKIGDKDAHCGAMVICRLPSSAWGAAYLGRPVQLITMAADVISTSSVTS